MLSLTYKQAELLAYIKQYLSENHGVAPSFQEMADAIGIASKSGAYRLIAALEERGLIVRMGNRSRAMRVCDPAPLEGYPTSALIAELARRREAAPQREVRAAQVRWERNV